MGIQTTGNSQIDGATAEIAIALRDAAIGLSRRREQEFYDEAMWLRDEIMTGALVRDAKIRIEIDRRRRGMN